MSTQQVDQCHLKAKITNHDGVALFVSMAWTVLKVHICISADKAASDLAATNIQRGRDHGLANYNRVRKAIGLTPIDESMQQRPAEISQENWDLLAYLYEKPDDIDLFTGGLAEDHASGGGEIEIRLFWSVYLFSQVQSSAQRSRGLLGSNSGSSRPATATSSPTCTAIIPRVCQKSFRYCINHQPVRIIISAVVDL